jgi:transcription initiation factor TFIIIB Brf1 subunit/transcription initiation factor TFIIB
MSKRVAPCPVCESEAFIESLTQGGLICADCGAVSNQVEIADDEDIDRAPRTFIKAHSYKHVTEEESKARMQRKKTLGLADRRGFTDILHGFSLLLDSMVRACVSHGLCSEDATITVRETWLDYLVGIQRSRGEIRILNGSPSFNLSVRMARWGIRDYRRVVDSSLLRQRYGISARLEERRIRNRGGPITTGAHFLIYAHDWLSLFLNLDRFPLPDYILLEYWSRGVSWSLIDSIRNDSLSSLSRSATGSLTELERRFLIKNMFVDVMNSEEILSMHNGVDGGVYNTRGEAPVDVETLLCILMIGLRRLKVGVLPIHLLNWISRGQLPYFSAHKYLSNETDRIEFYRLTRTSCGYKRSVFRPPECPSIERIIENSETIGIYGLETRIQSPDSMIGPCLDSLGLSPLADICKRILDRLNSFQDQRKIFEPDKDGIDRRKLVIGFSYSPADRKAYHLSTLGTNDVVLCVILVAMKLVFPDLHGPGAVGGIALPSLLRESMGTVFPIFYEVMSYEALRDQDIGHRWWKLLTEEEKMETLQITEREILEELRDSVIEELRQVIGRPAVMSRKEVEMKVTEGRYLLRSGRLRRYIVAPGTASKDSALIRAVVTDVGNVCGSAATADIFRSIRQVEKFLFLRTK